VAKEMKIRADQIDKAKIPKVGDIFTVIKVEQPHVWALVELEKYEEPEVKKSCPHFCTRLTCRSDCDYHPDHVEWLNQCKKSLDGKHCWIILDNGDIKCILCDFIPIKNFIGDWKVAGTKR
jgi:hypothetical protein